MAKTALNPLGHWDRRDWYITDDKQVVWKVPSLRDAVIAPPGYKILTADLPQAEIWIMALLANDTKLLQQLRSGRDIHSDIAADDLGVTYEEVYAPYKDPQHPLHAQRAEERSDRKFVTFSIPYGAGPDGIGPKIQKYNETLECATERALGMIQRFLGRYDPLHRYLEASGKQALRNGFSTSVSGRRRNYRIPTRSDRDYFKLIAAIERAAKNMGIQASCADVLKRADSQIYLRLRSGDILAEPMHDARVILNVHDEIGICCRDEGTKEVAAIQAEEMRDAFLYFFPEADISPDVTESDHWQK